MVKIGKWAEPYSEPGNPYPDETDSFAQMPPSCPLHILPYGMLSDKILPLIKIKRREHREQRKEFLINKTLNVNLILCFKELYRLSKLDPQNAIIHKPVNTSDTKQTMKQLVDDCDIPLIYLEEAYKKQLQGPPKIEVGDWVRFAELSQECYCYGWGVVQRVLGSKNLFVAMIMSRRSEDYTDYPIFNRWKRDWCRSVIKKKVSIWKCEKVGHDTPEWLRLRNKVIADYNNSLAQRKLIWNDRLESVIQQRGEPGGSSGGYRSIWFTMDINVLDKEVWKSITGTKKDNSHIIQHHLWWCFRRSYPILTGLKNIILEEGILD